MDYTLLYESGVDTAGTLREEYDHFDYILINIRQDVDNRVIGSVLALTSELNDLIPRGTTMGTTTWDYIVFNTTLSFTDSVARSASVFSIYGISRKEQ